MLVCVKRDKKQWLLICKAQNSPQFLKNILKNKNWSYS